MGTKRGEIELIIWNINRERGKIGNKGSKGRKGIKEKGVEGRQE